MHWTQRPEVREKLRQAKLGKKRKPFTTETLRRMSQARKGKWREQESWHWKGDSITYDALHKWKKKHDGNPPSCEQCGLEGSYTACSDGKRRWTIEWSNKSETYKRDLQDWEGLCIPCHRAKDAERRRLIGKVTK